MKKLAINTMSNQPAQLTIPTQADPDLILAPHLDNTSPSSSSASDDDNINDICLAFKGGATISYLQLVSTPANPEYSKSIGCQYNKIQSNSIGYK